MQSLESKGKMEQPTQAAKKLAKQIQAAEDKLGRYKTKMSELTAAGTAYGSDEWIKNQREIQKCTVEMEKLSRVKANLLNSKEAGQRPISLKSVIGGAAIKGFDGAIKGVGSGMKSLASGVIQKSSGAFSALIQKFSSGIPTLKRARSSFNGLGTSGKGLAGILKTVGMTAKFMFASFVIRGAINGAKQGFQNLAQYSGSTNSSISMLMSSLTQLKNSLAAAFAPILEVVAPILNSFVQMVIRAVNAVGQLIGALVLPVLLGYIVWLLKNQKKDRDANSKGTMLLLRTQLIEYHAKYMELGDIPSYAYQNFCEMYDAYHALGGNGMVTKMKQEIEELHIKRKGE